MKRTAFPILLCLLLGCESAETVNPDPTADAGALGGSTPTGGQVPPGPGSSTTTDSGTAAPTDAGATGLGDTDAGGTTGARDAADPTSDATTSPNPDADTTGWIPPDGTGMPDGTDPPDIQGTPDVQGTPDAAGTPDATADSSTPDAVVVVPPPTFPARYVRITTEQSPSWVAWGEVEVTGSWEAGEPVIQNLALNKAAYASSSTGDSSPAMAVDGETSTSWNSGDFPPAMWTVDLGEEAEITEIRIRVAQNPPGLTQHVLQLGNESGAFETVHTFFEFTENGDWLVFPTDEPVGPVGDWPRGLKWVRENPMFISGLCVSVDSVTQSQVHTYYDDFHANATHLWTNGLPNELANWEDALHPDMRWVVWLDDHGKSITNDEIIGGLPPNSPGRIGYQIGDEPGLTGDGMVELMEIEIGVDAVRAADPDALIIVNFSFWAEEIDEMLDYFGGVMDADIYSYDRYDFGYDEHDTLALIRDAALTWERPYWRYIRSYHDVDKSETAHVSALRWHALIGLLYGYTGHTWFVYQADPPHLVASYFFTEQGDLAAPKLPAWNEVAQINIEMSHYGHAITQLTSTDVRYVPGQDIYLPGALEKWTSGAGNDPFITSIGHKSGGTVFGGGVRDLAAGFFVDESGEIYVMIQNQNHQGADFPIDNLNAILLEVVFDFSTAPPGMDTSKLISLDPTSGAFVDLPLQPAPGGKMALELELDASHAVLFKYATGSPFVWGP